MNALSIKQEWGIYNPKRLQEWSQKFKFLKFQDMIDTIIDIVYIIIVTFDTIIILNSQGITIKKFKFWALLLLP